MRYFLDTEFIDTGYSVDLISLALVAEDGREFYALNLTCNWEQASPWLWENVLIYLPPKPMEYEYGPWHRDQGWLHHREIAGRVFTFLGGEVAIRQPPPLNDVEPNFQGEKRLKPGTPKPEFWGYYSAYDWVAFCQLYGRMIDLPNDLPRHCNDLKQWCHQLGNPRLPEKPNTRHYALSDARWNQQVWEFLKAHEASRR